MSAATPEWGAARAGVVYLDPEGELCGRVVSESKTDGKGVCVVARPPGKYRVEIEPTTGPSSTPPVRVEVKEGELSEAAFHFVIALR